MRLERRGLTTSQRDLQALSALTYRADLGRPTVEDFRKNLGRARVYGVGVFDEKEHLHGYAIYDTRSPERVKVHSLVVDPRSRLQGIGSRLLDYLVKTIREIGETKELRLVLDEENLDSSRFLRSYAKNSAIPLRTSLARGNPRDSYVFDFQVEEEPACVKR